MDQHLLLKALNAAQQGQKYAFATVVEATPKGTPQKAGAKMIVLEDGTIYGTIGGGRNEKAVQKECLAAVKTGKTILKTYDYFGQKGQSVCGGQMKVFIEPFVGHKNLVICGGGHIGLQLSVIAKMLDFHVTILDNRKEFCNKKRFPHTDKLLLGNYAAKLKSLKITADTYIMIVTQGNEYDYQCLKTVIKSDASYIGVISSQAKKVKFFKRLKKARIATKWLNRVHIPAGIDIGSQAPAEIAVSIAAEILAQKNKEFIGTSKFKKS